jgi:hypothetical protein
MSDLEPPPKPHSREASMPLIWWVLMAALVIAGFVLLVGVLNPAP